MCSGRAFEREQQGTQPFVTPPPLLREGPAAAVRVHVLPCGVVAERVSARHPEPNHLDGGR